MRNIILFIYQCGKQQCSNLTSLCIRGMLQTIKITKMIITLRPIGLNIAALCDVGRCCCLFACFICVLLCFAYLLVTLEFLDVMFRLIS